MSPPDQPLPEPPRPYDAGMTIAEAGAIADETIMFWRNRGITAADAWRALGGGEHGAWARVRAFMVRWLLEQGLAVSQRLEA